MTREQRRLAAIIAADVVGYSRLMGRDEAGTLGRLREHRRLRIEPTLGRHGGRIVKLTGDGVLAEFPSAVDALSAAIEIQQAMAEANQGLSEDTAIVFRIGLHLGDLIVDGDDLYGDGINIAARLESEALPGGITISSNLHDVVMHRLKASFEDIGQLTLKNIERPVHTYRVNWQAADWRPPLPATVASEPRAVSASVAAIPLALPDKPSIAVLPFTNMSGDPEQEYFADGMVEDIITALSRFNSLFVIARNSSFSYKGKTPNIRTVGRELGVRYVLEGSVRKVANQVRITGQLINCESGAHLWADRFDGSLEDVFGLQDRVTTSVVGAIAPTVDRAEIERVRRKPVENLDAYDCFLRGLALTYMQTRDAWDEAHKFLYRAIELDPNFSTPYGIACRVYGYRKVQGWVVDQKWEKDEVRRLAAKVSAIGRDDALALSWAGLGLGIVCNERDAGAALVDRALAVNPNLATGWTSRGSVSLWIGRHEEACELLARALRLNPIDPESFRPLTMMALARFLQGRYDEASSWARKALGFHSTWRPALAVTAASDAHAGRVDEARAMVNEIRQIDPTARLTDLMTFMPLSLQRDLDVFVEGLRKAGLPD